ncbi:MAG: TIGR03617 family F420-dependent LLM class oxidoreductase [Pseudomonadales bacterium]|jgi:probable F420-dependent oxidoreductase|nr:TIGR03617 family F420-dependent LLM class oxidoreductase [Pseudomonadales bacterium]MDP6471110.1 TIGR03617 family F420-dependent LLM class oxidoreductase [Pseudomonadales bacterium]MDP6825704.1 TIGR03617 family F420-dependent LLM class oxidoreductase [Pseudomonadales bacterium]MDP6973160.1 TIGR03617 family F420-dependent LLM class oxidoreductase [Pseudomonadales bacterium]|tara:strand:+ start:1228 stop:2235 length:1008 start_codon:yes stop_codon:yes gene_type:complete
MKVDAGLGHDLKKIPDAIRKLEAAGYDGVNTAEMNHDPFYPLVLAAEHSKRIELRTSIAVAFARSPMNLANLGHDLNAYSGGRFTLGLGSQIRPHITKRFSMQWGAPAAQMRELVLAMRAIWANWYEKKPLQYVGKYYTHTLMTPAFTPENTEQGAPRVVLAAVGPGMTEVAGEVADGMIIHPFSNLPYIESVTVPAIEKGLAMAGRSRDDFELSYSCFVVTGRDEAEFEASLKATRERIAFYGSTPAYTGVLEAIGVGELQGELNAMSKQGRWQEMGTLITDDIVREFGVVGSPDEIAPQMLERYGSFVDRTSASFPVGDDEQRQQIISALRQG